LEKEGKEGREGKRKKEDPFYNSLPLLGREKKEKRGEEIRLLLL